MARTYSRCRRGERLRVGVPHGHWKTTTFVAVLTTRGMVAPFVLDSPINRIVFETYVERVLARGFAELLFSARGALQWREP
jgi:hypothetical protein